MGKLARLPALGRAPDAVAEARPIPRFQTRYYAFLSYSHKDKALADWLHRELERFRVPHALAGKLGSNGVVPKRLMPVFRDEHELAAAHDLGEEIRAALASSQFLIVLCSPSAAKSRWTNAEIEAFKRTRPETCVLAAIASGEPFASDIVGRKDEECFPPALRHKYDRRGRPTSTRAEPLAADLRETGEARRIGLLKLIAGMLGVGLDELVRREARRRHRRLAWLAAGSLAGMSVTSTLSVVAIQSRNTAREQRREAEGLVEFMLGDLKDKLEPIGKLDALDRVGSRVLDYYSKQDPSELSDSALLQRSRALSLTAQVAFLRGNMDSAIKLYQQAEVGTEEGLRRRPNDPQSLFEQAQNVFWLGEIAHERGKTSEAETAFREYLRLANRMVSIDPENMKWRMEVLYAREDLGQVLMSQRRFPEATAQFDANVRSMDSIASIDSSQREYRIELINALGWLADGEQALGRFDRAIAVRQRQAAYLERLGGREGSDVALQQQLVTAHRALGALFTSRGEVEHGIGEFRLALEQVNELMSIEPKNSTWKDQAARVHLQLARNLLALAQRREAEQQTEIGCGIADTLPAGVSRWARLRTTCLASETRLALASGAKSQALGFAKQALASARAERSGDPIADRYAVASGYRLLGDTFAALGNSVAARAAWSEAVGVLSQNVAEQPQEMDEHTIILQRLGRTAEARPLISKLSAMRYRRLT